MDASTGPPPALERLIRQDRLDVAGGLPAT
jgi:hypothetical protein